MPDTLLCRPSCHLWGPGGRAALPVELTAHDLQVLFELRDAAVVRAKFVLHGLERPSDLPARTDEVPEIAQEDAEVVAPYGDEVVVRPVGRLADGDRSLEQAPRLFEP